MRGRNDKNWCFPTFYEAIKTASLTDENIYPAPCALSKIPVYRGATSQEAVSQQIDSDLHFVYQVMVASVSSLKIGIKHQFQLIQDIAIQ